MLTALALGARELAGLPGPTGPPRSNKQVFPSKMLSATLHRKYLLDEKASADAGPVGLLAYDISRLALERGKKEAEDRVPQIIREKQLRLRKPAPSIVDVGEARPLHGVSFFEASNRPPVQTAFKDVAADFIIPLIERFWQHLRDEQMRETRVKAGNGYRGAGSGMILDALVLSQLLRTLSVLVHAARHSIAFLRMVAPEALEVAVTIGTRPVSVTIPTSDEEFEEIGKGEKETSVLASSLELALIVLDACVDLDGGRELGLEQTMLLLSTRDWASEVFCRLEEMGGVEIDKASGDDVNRVRRGAAGLLLKIEEVMDRWRRSMISV
jgi:telomere length regulation protein